MSRTLTGWSFWGTRGSRGTEAPARQPGTRVNPLQRAGPIRVRAEIPSVTRKRAFLNQPNIASRDQLRAIPTIEDRVDIGCGVCVLGKVTIGHDSFIGANAVVVLDIPPFSPAVGVPARVIKQSRASGQQA